MYKVISHLYSNLLSVQLVDCKFVQPCCDVQAIFQGTMYTVHKHVYIVPVQETTLYMFGNSFRNFYYIIMVDYVKWRNIVYWLPNYTNKFVSFSQFMNLYLVPVFCMYYIIVLWMLYIMLYLYIYNLFLFLNVAIIKKTHAESS